MKKTRNITFYLFILLSGCTFGNEVKPSDAPTANQVGGMTESPESTPSRTPQESCNLPDDIKQIKIEGQIVFQASEGGLYFYNPVSAENQIIPNTNDAFALLVAPSPDHKRIAFFDFSSESGGIISENGSIVEINTKGKIDGIFYGWQDNNNIVFVERSHSDGSIITFDVNNGSVNEVVTRLHDLSFDPTHWYAGGDQPSVIFDSTLSRLIYLSGELPGESAGKWGFIMRDRNTQNILWSSVSSDFVAKPKWSPDNEFVAIVITSENESGDQIYIIDRAGKEIKKINTNAIGIDTVEWSPDGKQIGLARNKILVVYNLYSNQLQEYQLHEGISRIIWSPAGNQIASNGSLIDLSTDCVFTLKPDDVFGPLAWLVGAP